MKIRPYTLIVCSALGGAMIPGRASADPAAPPAPPAPSNSAAVPQVAPAPSPVPAPTPEEINRRRVAVDIDATKSSAVVERQVSLTESNGAYFYVPFHASSAIWEQVCVTPCQVDLDRYSTYRVAGRNGTSASRSFTLPQGSQALQLKVDSGDLTMHRAGAVVASAGLAAVIVGVALVAAQSVFTDETKARDAGFITGGSGIVLMGVGIPLVLATSTSVFSGGSKIAATSRGFTF